MSWKKKKKIEKMNTRIIEIISGLIIILLILVWLLGSKLSGRWKTEVYKIEPRITNVADVKIEKESDYSAIGWLRVQGTNIDFPIIRTDNSKSEFPAELESFAWSLNHDDKFHNRIFIMGHNIFNLSANPKKRDERFHRFEELMAFVYDDFARENQYIQLTIDGEDYIYKIFSVSFLNANEIYGFSFDDDYSKDAMEYYLDLMEKYDIYDYDVDVSTDDSIISLSTCTRMFGVDANKDLFVNGRLLRKNEKMTLSKVKKSDKYQEMEDKWEGDLKDETDNM